MPMPGDCPSHDPQANPIGQEYAIRRPPPSAPIVRPRMNDEPEQRNGRVDHTRCPPQEIDGLTQEIERSTHGVIDSISRWKMSQSLNPPIPHRMTAFAVPMLSKRS